MDEIKECWKVASTIWKLPPYTLMVLFPDCAIEEIFEHYSPTQAKKILHDAGVMITK